MNNHDAFRIGIAGACGRGASFKLACDALGIRVQAACDTNAAGLPDAAARLGAAEQYTDFDTMLDRSALDSVIIGTPMHFHVPQAIAALRRNLHVLSEVPAGVSMDECKALVLAAKASRGIYMMAENYTYIRSNAVVREIVRRGLLGTTYYGEGEYIHELKELNEITRWRRKWQTGINGITYPTHSLGPILQWMPGDRVISACCAGSGHHYKDPRGAVYENEDSCVMLCKMRSGGLVKIRVDMLSDRPHAMTNYQVQGTDGCYESARAHGDRHRIWLRSRCKDPCTWLDLADLENEFLPEFWKIGDEQARKAGHGGGDYFEVLDFVDAALGKRPAAVGIHDAMDMTLPGLVSQQSILEGGRWIDVPDSREWSDQPPYRQLHMIWPEARLNSPPEPKLPAGYVLRQYTDADEPAYIELMGMAGFTGWTHDRVTQSRNRTLPDGFFLAVHGITGKLVATAVAQHSPTELHPYGGEMGWVAGNPDHKGKGLGMAVTAAATARLIRAGYRDIRLQTDDFRLPAIKSYLKLGFQPLLCAPEMQQRWENLFAQLKWNR